TDVRWNPELGGTSPTDTTGKADDGEQHHDPRYEGTEPFGIAEQDRRQVTRAVPVCVLHHSSEQAGNAHATQLGLIWIDEGEVVAVLGIAEATAPHAPRDSRGKDDHQQ